MSNLYPPFYDQVVFKSDGTLNVGGSVEAYYSKTSNPAPIYNEDGNEIAQPIIIGADGRVNFLLEPTLKYRIIIKDPLGVLLVDRDPVQATLSNGDQGFDELVKVSATDTQSGYLADKLVQGNGISLTTESASGVETLRIDSTGVLEDTDNTFTGVNEFTHLIKTPGMFEGNLTNVFFLNDGTRMLISSASQPLDITTNGVSISANVSASTPPTQGQHLTNKTYVDGLDSDNAKLSENQTFTGANEFTQPVSASTPPSIGAHLTNRTYVDGLVSGIGSGLDYQGTWNAASNSPTLASGVGTQGYYYIVSVAGSTNLDGITDWNVGDWVLWSENAGAWQQVDNTSFESVSNVGSGAGIFKQVTGGTDVQLRSITTDSNLTASENASNVQISAPNMAKTNSNQTFTGVNTFDEQIISPKGISIELPLNTLITKLPSTYPDGISWFALSQNTIDIGYPRNEDGNTFGYCVTTALVTTGGGSRVEQTYYERFTGLVYRRWVTSDDVWSTTSSTGWQQINGDYATFDVEQTFTEKQIFKGNDGVKSAISVTNQADAEVIELWSDGDGDGYFAINDSNGTNRFLVDSDGSLGYRALVTGNFKVSGDSEITGDLDVGGVASVVAPNGTTGSLLIRGGNSVVSSVGEVQSKLEFGTNDPSVTGLIGGKIEAVTEISNGARIGLAFYTASSTSLTEAMRIRYDNNVEMYNGLSVTGTLKIGVYTTAQKNALSVPAGTQVYDSTLNQLSVYNGSTWTDLGSGGGGSTKASYQSTTNVANISGGSALSGSGFSTLVVPECDIDVNKFTYYVTSASAGSTCYFGIYDQAGTTLLGEASGSGATAGYQESNATASTISLTGGTPYRFAVLEGGGAVNLGSNTAYADSNLNSSGFVSGSPTGMPASISGFSASTTRFYIGVKN